MPKIIEFQKPNNLSQASQTLPVLFTFAKQEENGDVQCLHEWIMCRDYLGDAIYANKYKKELSVYGFVSTPERTPIPEGDFLMLLKFPAKNHLTTFLDNFPILGGVEEMNKTSPTNISFVQDLTVLLSVNSFWKRSIPLISLFSFLIKVCSYPYKDKKMCFEELNGMGKTESMLIRNSVEKFRQFLPLLSTIFPEGCSLTGFPNEENLAHYTIHGGCGFYSTFIRNSGSSFSTHFKELTTTKVAA